MEHEVTDMTGKPIPSRYKSIAGAQPDFVVPEVRHLRVVIHGAVGSGKSTLVRSIPNGIVFDMDHKAGAIVGADPTNLAVYCEDAGGYESWIDQLVEDAQRNKKFFDVVSFDPLNRYVDFVRDLLTVRANEGSGKNIDDIARWGKEGAGWDRINTYVKRQLSRLYFAGYGLATTIHLTERVDKIQKGNDLVTVKGWDSASTPAILKFVMAECEYACSAHRFDEVSTEDVEQTYTVRGVERTRTNKKTVRRTRFMLQFDPAVAPVATRMQFPLEDPELTVPLRGGWDIFSEAHTNAAEAVREVIKSGAPNESMKKTRRPSSSKRRPLRKKSK